MHYLQPMVLHQFTESLRCCTSIGVSELVQMRVARHRHVVCRCPARPEHNRALLRHAGETVQTWELVDGAGLVEPHTGELVDGKEAVRRLGCVMASQEVAQ